MIDAVASDYQDSISFVAVAGNSSESASRQRVGTWFSPERILWGYDESIWSLYGVRGQPVSFLITGDDIVVASWFGALDEAEMRHQLDILAAYG